MSGTDAADIERIEKALREWRQGDATLDVGTFVVHLADKRAPLTDEARDAVARGEVDGGEDVFEVLSAGERRGGRQPELRHRPRLLEVGMRGGERADPRRG